MKRIVRCWFAPRRSRACRITARTSSTRAETADSSSKSAPVRSATIRASVVLPTPGGPKRIIDGGRSSSIARRSAEPSASTWRWPTRSSSVRGRMRCGRGAIWPMRPCAASSKRSGMGASMLIACPSPRPRTSRSRCSPGTAPSDYERYLNTGGAARPAKRARRVGAPRRAAVPGRAPVLRAVAQARHARGRGGDRAHRCGRCREALSAACGGRRSACATSPNQLDMLEQMSPVGVPDDPGGARARLRLRLTRVQEPARSAARSRRRIPRGAREGRASRSPTSTCTAASTRSCTSSPRR